MSAKKVLIIDDSQTIRRSAENMLSSEGVEILTAEDGFQALSIIAEHLPNLIFIDIVMPKLDGYQACAIIKNNPDFKHIPVIMLTSKDGLFDRARGRVVGSDHYLTKPFTKDELLSSLQQHLPA
jgi:twitching motility two-component system response regulator PilG